MSAQPDASVLQHTIEVLECLFALSRHVALHGEDHDDTRLSAQALERALSLARPPFALQLLPEAVLRDGIPLPLELEVYRRSQQLVGALARWGMSELAFEAVLPRAALVKLASAVLEATHSGRTARVPELAGVRFRALKRPGLPGQNCGEAARDVYIGQELERALALAQHLCAERQSWPWQTGKTVVFRLERCVLAGIAATARQIEIARPPWPPARRMLALSLFGVAALARVQASQFVQRTTAHALLALGAFGLLEREGAPLREAARLALGSLLPRAPEDVAVDPHRLRVCALLAAAAQDEAAAAALPLQPLLAAAYELERRRCPPQVDFNLSRADLQAWLVGALGREVHAGWGRALLDALGPFPAGSHVLADGRLGVVIGAAPDGDALRPRVLVGGQMAVPAQPVTLYSPLGMTPWAK